MNNAASVIVFKKKDYNLMDRENKQKLIMLPNLTNWYKYQLYDVICPQKFL